MDKGIIEYEKEGPETDGNGRVEARPRSRPEITFLYGPTRRDHRDSASIKIGRVDNSVRLKEKRKGAVEERATRKIMLHFKEFN